MGLWDEIEESGEDLIEKNIYIEDIQEGMNLLTDLLSVNTKKTEIYEKIGILRKLIEEDYVNLANKEDLPNEAEAYGKILNGQKIIEKLVTFPFLSNKQVVAIGGSFSAGKSKFINSILNHDILPTDTTPTTSIPTNITYGKIDAIFALNIFGNKIRLNEESLGAITHKYSDKYDISFTQILENITIQSERMPYKNIIFLDTPGYTKAESYKKEDNTDERVAREHLGGADYLIWVVDIERGTITKDDIEFIKKLEFNKPIFFIFNKADKKEDGDVKEILKQAKKDLQNYDIKVENIIAYSSMDRSEYLMNSEELKRSRTPKLLYSSMNKRIFDGELIENVEEDLNFYQKVLDEDFHKIKRLFPPYTRSEHPVKTITNSSLNKYLLNIDSKSKELDIVKIFEDVFQIYEDYHQNVIEEEKLELGDLNTIAIYLHNDEKLHTLKKLIDRIRIKIKTEKELIGKFQNLSKIFTKTIEEILDEIEDVKKEQIIDDHIVSCYMKFDELLMESINASKKDFMDNCEEMINNFTIIKFEKYGFNRCLINEIIEKDICKIDSPRPLDNKEDISIKEILYNRGVTSKFVRKEDLIREILNILDKFNEELDNLKKSMINLNFQGQIIDVDMEAKFLGVDLVNKCYEEFMRNLNEIVSKEVSNLMFNKNSFISDVNNKFNKNEILEDYWDLLESIVKEKMYNCRNEIVNNFDNSLKNIRYKGRSLLKRGAGKC